MPRENERKFNMAEKTAVLKRETMWTRVRAFMTDYAVWALAGFALELGASVSGAAPGASALIAGLSGNKGFSAAVGGLFGALLRGIPDCFMGAAAIAIVLAARLIPDMNNIKLRTGIRAATAAAACFFPRAAEITEPSALLFGIVAAVTSGVFAACVCLLSESVSLRGFDISEERDCAKAAVITAAVFMSLGALDYPIINIGRLALGLLLLTVTARRGLAWCAVFGTSAVFGLCAADPRTGAAGAAIAFAAAVSSIFSKYGKFIRAAGFVFFACAGVLAAGIDDGTWCILTETALAGAAFAIIPVEKIKTAESDISDSTVAMLLRERLCFAADAISGIGRGIDAAAETLDRKYGLTLEQAAERAADRSCRSCPNSMICWGEKYELFKGEFSRLIKMVRSGTELTEHSISPQCAEICVDKASVVRAVTKEYERFLSASADEQRIREMRRIYTDQLEGIHDILCDMGCTGIDPKKAARSRTAEKRTEKLLSECGMTGAQAFITFDRRGKLRFEAYGNTEPNVDREYLGGLLINAVGRELELPEITSGGGRCRVTAQERTALSAEIGAFQLCRGKNRVCGDCYDSFTDAQGILYVILSDGMGSGSRARVDSAMACSVIARLLKSGITLPTALETVNTALMVKSADESYATLDICRIDLNTGECAVYKAGAAVTYIKSADRLIRASLSSPPAGTGGKLTVPAQKFTVAAGDMIIMTTDGAVLDEEWLSRELSQPSTPKELSERIARAARAAENGREDDISIIAVSVGA